MNILYEGFDGTPALAFYGWAIIIIGTIFIIAFIIALRVNFHDSGVIIIFIMGLILVGSGILLNNDNRVPIIKATINEQVSWREIVDKYELKGQEGQIYVFKVNNVTNEEWENYLKEKENK